MITFISKYAKGLCLNFGGGGGSPAPLPEDPANSAEAKRKREEAEAAALAEQRAAGRRSTIVGGARAAMEERQNRKNVTLG